MFLILNFKIHNDVLLILDENLSIKIYPSHLEQVFKIKINLKFIVLFCKGYKEKEKKLTIFALNEKTKKISG